MSRKIEIQSLRPYKYRTRKSYVFGTSIGGHWVSTDFYSLQPDGDLLIENGYAWNGTSGGVPDTKRNLGASLVHDCFYQMLREGQLPMKLRRPIDELFGVHCRQLGTWRPVARVYVRMLQRFGAKAARRDQDKVAPTRMIPAPKAVLELP